MAIMSLNSEIFKDIVPILDNLSIPAGLQSKAYDHVVQLACPSWFIRDCQIKILRMLSPTPIPLSLFKKQSTTQDEFILKFLPEAKKVHRQHINLYATKLTSFEQEVYELRESFCMDFNFSNLTNINSDLLLYFISAFGSEKKYETFIGGLSILQSNMKSQSYPLLALYVAFKYGNVNLIT